MPASIRARAAFWERAALAALLAVALATAAVWALLVPLYGGTDEVAHLDYAFALYDAGRPFTVQSARVGTLVTPQAVYAAAQTGYRRMRYDTGAPVPPGYGSASFLRRFDAGAPPRSLKAPAPGSPVPYAAFVYPEGYYALVAVAMTFATEAWHSLAATLLTARLVNVALLGGTLALAYGIFRRAGFAARDAWLATCGIGFLPLTSWVAGYVQPDNLSLFLITAVCRAAQSARDVRASRALFAATLALAALAFTKQHFALPAWFAFGAAAVAWAARPGTSRGVRLATLGVLVIPAAAIALSFSATPVRGHATSAALFRDFSHGATVWDYVAGGASIVGRTFLDMYGGGTIFDFFWNRVTTREFGVVPDTFAPALRAALVAATLATIGAVLVRRYRIFRRIVAVRRRLAPWRAAAMMLGDVPASAYVCVTLALALACAATRGGLLLVGRYWLPVIVPMMFFIAVDLASMAPRASRGRFRTALLAGFATFAVLGDASALLRTHADYYGPPRPLAVEPVALARIVATAPGYDGPARVRAGNGVRVRGFAVDAETGFPARRVAIDVDGAPAAIAHTGVPMPGLVVRYHDAAIENAGFVATLPALRAGRHVVSFRVLAADRAYTLPFAQTLTVDALAPAPVRAVGERS